jgi:hypothetical protein
MWTIVASLVTSVIGGFIAGWLVLCKSERNLKRAYARQIWSEFFLAVNTLYSLSYSLISVLDRKIVEDIKLVVSDEQSIKRFNEKLRSWRDSSDFREKLRECDKAHLRKILTWLTHQAISEQGKFRCLFTTYPIQINYFGECYQTKLWLDAVFTISESDVASLSDNRAEGHAGSIIAMMPDTIQRLRNTYLEIERHSHTKSSKKRVGLN